MVNKLDGTPTQNQVIDKVNEITTSIPYYGTSSTGASTVEKAVSIPAITSLNAGQVIYVRPSATSTVADSTIKLNNFTAYAMRYNNANISTSTDSIVWNENFVSTFIFDGTYWQFAGHGLDTNTNTTYSAMSVSEGTTGTATNSRTVRADYLKQIIQGTKLTGLSTSDSSEVVATDTVLGGIGKLQAQINASKILINIEYADLVTLKTNGELYEGAFYRIVDYVTTCNGNTYNGGEACKSAGHQFDIIIEALGNSTLSDRGTASLHSGDTYFANSNLGAWQIWYDINNDTNKYRWADDTNGKGVIYRLIDEYYNDVPYDFKNIQFYRDNTATKYASISAKLTASDGYYYTFSLNTNGTITDYSISALSLCSLNTFGLMPLNGAMRALNNNVIMATANTDQIYDNSYTISNYGNTIIAPHYSNDLGAFCYNNVIDTGAGSNLANDNFHNNTIGGACVNNVFGANCYNNVIPYNSYQNTFGNAFHDNTGTATTDGIQQCQFGNKVFSNTFGNKFRRNTLGNYVANSTFGTTVQGNSVGNNCAYITFDNSISGCILGNSCGYLTISVNNLFIASGLRGSSTAYLTTSGLSANGAIYVNKDSNSNFIAIWNDGATTVGKTKTTANASWTTDITNAQVQADWNQSDSNAVDYIKNKPSGLTVDQTYDGTSTNAQSGVAIEGELTTNYQTKLVSGTDIKTINNTTLLGSGNIDTSEVFVAEYGVTSYADVQTAYNSGKIIFCQYTVSNTLLFIPLSGKNLNVSSGDVEYSFVCSLNANGDYYCLYLNSSGWFSPISYGVVKTTSTMVSSSRFDGQWVTSTTSLSSSTAVNTYTIDVSSYLPNDGYDYEVLIEAKPYKSTSGDAITAIGSDILTDYMEIGIANSNARQAFNCFSIPVGTGRAIYYQIKTNALNSSILNARAYRRLGTNS